VNSYSWRWLALLALLSLPAPSLRAAEEPASGILFARLRVKDGTFSLVSVANVPGVLKARRGPAVPRDFQVVLEDVDGKELWMEPVDDPTVQRIEYEDPAHPGKLQVKEIRRTEAEFTVRLPAKAGRRQLAIYRMSEAPATAVPGPQTPTRIRERVARLALPEDPAP
jgi:hypothetical protein